MFALTACKTCVQLLQIFWPVFNEATTTLTNLLAAADSSVQYLQPYYDALDIWDPPPNIAEERKAGRKRAPHLPFVWLLVYRHLSGSGYHPRPFDHGIIENLNLFLFAKKPYAYQVDFPTH